MKIGKPKSKRVPVRLRHRIEKASAAKQRKSKKDAKKNPQWRSKLKKDPGIPNLFPYKDKILQEIEEKRRLKEEEIIRRRESAHGEPSDARSLQDTSDEDSSRPDTEERLDEALDEDEFMQVDDTNPMAALLASAKARAAQFERRPLHSTDDMEEDGDEEYQKFEDGPDADDNATTRPDSSRRAFDKIYKQVVESADVVLYVLDARDPEGTRSKEVEQLVMAADKGSKRMIYVLNKIDLVPPTVLRQWLVHLRRSFPTLPLRASKPAPNAKIFDHKELTMKATSETLFRALKTFAESRQLKRAIKVGIIGYPNVGKSSVINALTSRLGGRAGACPVGAEAGVTTSMREVKIDNKLRLLDSPGIVFPNSPDGNKASKVEEQARLILLNAVPPKEINDPIPAVTLLLKRLSASSELFSKIVEVYDLPPLHMINGDTTTDFLVQVARKRGRLGKGGVPNLHSAAQTVITDWRDGRIQGWTDPPAYKADTAASAKSAPAIRGQTGDHKAIVKEWAAEFKLEGLWGDGETGEHDIMEV